MIEVTFTEIALFCWAVLATGYAFKYHQQFKGASRLVVMMVEHAEVREKLVEAKNQFLREQGL